MNGIWNPYSIKEHNFNQETTKHFLTWTETKHKHNITIQIKQDSITT